MNERIRELSKQAFEYTLDRLNSGLEFRDFQPIWSEKFAELIVRECVKIAYQNDIAKFTRDGYQIGMDIQKHFGVEE